MQKVLEGSLSFLHDNFAIDGALARWISNGGMVNDFVVELFYHQSAVIPPDDFERWMDDGIRGPGALQSPSIIMVPPPSWGYVNHSWTVKVGCRIIAQVGTGITFIFGDMDGFTTNGASYHD